LYLIILKIQEPEFEEIENMNYVQFKYMLYSFLAAARIIYDFPPNDAFYRFGSALPENPSEKTALIQRLPDLIQLKKFKNDSLHEIGKNL